MDIALLGKVLLLTVSWGVFFFLVWREIFRAKPLPDWGAILVLPILVASVVGIISLTSGFEDTLPEAIWVACLVGAIIPFWFFKVKADRRTVSSILIGMATVALLAFVLWPKPGRFLEEPTWLLSLPPIEEAVKPNPISDSNLPKLPLPNLVIKEKP